MYSSNVGILISVQLQIAANTLTFNLSFEPGVSTKPSSASEPTTLQKQLVVCPMPAGRTWLWRRALITELFPLLVRPKKAT